MDKYEFWKINEIISNKKGIWVKILYKKIKKCQTFRIWKLTNFRIQNIRNYESH